MSIKHVYLYSVVPLLLTAGQAYADCQRFENVKPVEIDMQFGRVVVRPDLPVGATIRERSWPMPENDKVYWAQCTGGTVLDAIMTRGMTAGANKIYPTGIPGVGIRFSRTGTITMTYPDTYIVPSDRYLYLAGSEFKAELIKTAERTGSGVVPHGEYTRYGYQPNSVLPALITYLSAEAITIVSPSCLITSGQNQDVWLPEVKYNAFSGTGSTAGNKPFAIKMLCSGGLSDKGYSDINITFNADLAPDTDESKGVLINQINDNSAAKGVGIQVLDTNDRPLLMQKPYEVGRLTTNNDTEFTLNYIAKYYQYGTSITPGDVHAKMVFNLTYD